MKRLRVLVITGEYPPMEGGVADYTYLLCQEMAAQDAEVAVLTSSGAGEQRQDGEVLCLPWITRWNLPVLANGLQRAVRLYQPDILLIQYQTAAFQLKPAINLLPSLFPGLKFAVTFHDLREPYLFPKAGRLRRWVNLKLACSCRVVIATNAEDEQQLAAFGMIKKLELIPIASNIQFVDDQGLRDTIRARYQLDAGACVLGYFGLANASKGVEELVQALALVRAEGLDAILLIIGGGLGASDPTNVAYLARIKELIHANNLEAYVRWTGHLAPSEVSVALQCCDIAVLPYRDGASFRRGSLMATLAHGLPIITTRPPLPSEELAALDLVPPGDPTSLATEIIHVAQDEGCRRHLALQASLLARQFTWADIARRNLEVLYAAVER